MNDEWVMGRHSVKEALTSGRSTDKLLVAEGAVKGKGGIGEILRLAQERGIPVSQVPRRRLDQLAEGGNHQGVMAQVASFDYARLEDIFARAESRGEAPFFLLLDGIEDPHNLGSILRTADAAGVHGVIIPKRRAVGLTSTVAKTSAGAIEHVPVVRVTNLNRTADELKEQGVWLIGSDAQAPQSYSQVDYTLPTALVIGNEGKGISRLLKEKCDLLIQLPMKGHVSSLNASVAAALLMYEVLRKRQE
jgi:23S rRNA (guanosine2251-2'-O)-methyltransferase